MVVGQTNIKVVVRVRPYNRHEMGQNQRCIIKVMDRTMLLFDPEQEDDEFFYQGAKQLYRDITKRVNKKLSMEFDRVFDTDTNNTEIFEECTAPLIDAVLDGYNCSVFVYGATGAGKTYTMLGSEQCAGLTYLTMSDLFAKIDAKSELHKFDVGVSYLEVYNEQVMNLLTKSGPLKLREDANGVVVSGLALKPIRSAQELLQLLALGNANRTQHPTDANAESSRSHAVFQVHIRMTNIKTGTKRTVKLSMIDLAGSERAASTKGMGLRFKEGASINKSLLALGNCINKLADGQKHIPYRDSNLTRILKDSLGGNCQTLMVANVSMSSLTYEDTYNTLKYASRAKKIRLTLRQNAIMTNMPKDFYVRKVDELMTENAKLAAKVAALETSAAAATATITAARVYDETELKPWYAKIDAVYSSVIKTQEYAFSLQSKIKSLSFRMKLQDDAHTYHKQLNLNGQKIQAHECLLTKEIDGKKEELLRWRKKFQDAHRDLDKLKMEIKGSKYANILQIYQRGKDLEVQNAIENIKVNHVLGINGEFRMFSQNLRQTLSTACSVVQHCYDKLKLAEKETLNGELQQRVGQLQEMLNSLAMPLKEDFSKNCYVDMATDLLDMEPQTAEKRMFQMEEVDLPTTSNGKKLARQTRLVYHDSHDGSVDEDVKPELIDSNSSSESVEFKKPLANLNEMRVLRSAHDVCNTTIVYGSNGSGQLTASSVSNKKPQTVHKSNLVNHILSEQIVRLPNNKDQMRNALLKSNNFSRHGLLRAVAAGMQKENKKYSPNRIQKATQNTMAKVIHSTGTGSTLARKPINSATAKTNAAPTVRTNRAASFRVNK